MPRFLSPKCLGGGIALLGLALPALAQFAVPAHVVAGGGGRSQSPAGCYRLDATLGEPAAGRQSGGSFVLEAGYWAGPGVPRRDVLFNHGFEECQ